MDDWHFFVYVSSCGASNSRPKMSMSSIYCFCHFVFNALRFSMMTLRFQQTQMMHFLVTLPFRIPFSFGLAVLFSPVRKNPKAEDFFISLLVLCVFFLPSWWIAVHKFLFYDFLQDKSLNFFGYPAFILCSWAFSNVLIVMYLISGFCRYKRLNFFVFLNLIWPWLSIVLPLQYKSLNFFGCSALFCFVTSRNTKA